MAFFSFRHRSKVGWEQLKHMKIPSQTQIRHRVREWQRNDKTIDKRRLVLMKRKEIKIGNEIQI